MKHISIQQCDMDGDNRLRVCYSACESYNTACGARLDCSDRTLFSGEGSNDKGMCTGDGAVAAWWMLHFSTLLLIVAFCLLLITFSLFAVVHHEFYMTTYRGTKFQKVSNTRSGAPSLKIRKLEDLNVGGPDATRDISTRNPCTICMILHIQLSKP